MGEEARGKRGMKGEMKGGKKEERKEEKSKFPGLNL